MKTSRSAILTAIAACVVATAQAQPVAYATQTTPIKAGVVLLRDQAGFVIPSSAPHIWGILDGDKTVKPPEWRFESGLGNGVLTTSAAARWGVPAAAGTPIDKTYAPYWEVDLRSASNQDVDNFDVLQVSMPAVAQLTSEEREKLRGFVDKGGLLWIDFTVNGSGVDGVNNFPAPITTRVAPAGPAGQIQLNPFHPLAIGPNPLSLGDIYAMSAGNLQVVLDPFSLGASPVAQILRGAELDSLRTEAVATSDNSAVIALSQVGNGYVLLTSRGVSRIINRDFTGGSNAALTAAPALRDVSYTAAAKLIMNALALRSRFASAAAGSRNSSSTAVTIGVPAIKSFAAPAFAGQKGTPVLANGRLIVSSGGTLYVYDADPASDLDRDGNPDDGLADPVGSSYDRVWSSANFGAISEPTYVEIPGAAIAEQIWVQSTDGRLLGFNLNQTTFTGVTPFAAIDPPTTGPSPQPEVFAPTFHEGILYVADAGAGATPQGRLWMVNPRMAADIAMGGGNVNEARNVDDDGNVLGNYAWGGDSSPNYHVPGASPSIAYIPIEDGSGGLDLVAYIGCKRTTGAFTSPVQLTSLFLGARGEVPRDVSRAATALNLQTRVAQQGVRVSVVTGARSPKGLTVRAYVNGQPFTAAQMATYFTGVVLQPSNGTIQLQIQPAQVGAFDWDGKDTPGNPNDDVSYRVDYMCDWTTTGAPINQMVRGNILVMDQNIPQLDLMAPPAVSASGNVGLIVASPDGGSYYNIEESGIGTMWVRSRFEFHGAITNLGALGSSVGYPPSLVDEDDLVRLVPPLNQAMSKIRPVGIAAAGDSFYVQVAATKSLGGFGIPTGAILSFKASPPDPEFTVNLGSGQNNTGLLLKQPDMARSGYAALPGLFSSIPSNVFSIEPIANSTRAKIRMSSLASGTRGSMNSCLASNLPVIVNRSGTTDTIYEPEAPADNGAFFKGFASGRWSPLNWYTVMNGYVGQVGPVVAGERVIVGGASFLPGLVVNGFTGIPTGIDGLLFGMDARISPDDPNLISTAARPWVSQLYMLKSPAPAPFNFTGVVPAKAIRWPQARGITDLDDFRVRILQASLLGETQLYGLAAGEGGIAVTTDANTTLFRRSDFLIADNGRISRFDPSGNPLFSLEGTSYGGTNQPGVAERTRRMSSPNRVYADGQNGYVFTDPGNNLVARVDSSGREIRSITGIKFHQDVFATTDPAHPELSPRGQTQNEPKLLRNPQDVAFWTSYVTAADVQRLFPSEGAYRTYTNERWDNWLIADAGNNRVIQLIDRYTLDSAGRVAGVVRYRDVSDNEDANNLTPALGILWWHSPEEFSGKRYAYNSISRATVDVGGSIRTAYAMGFNNVQPSLRTFGLDTNPSARGDNPTGYGGAVIYDGPSTKVINEIVLPATPANVLMGTAGANFAFNLPARAAQTIAVSGLTSVTVKYRDFGSGPVLTAMLSTDRGVFEVVETSPNVWSVIWQLPVEVYEFMRRPVGNPPTYTPGQLASNPEGFRAMHAKRLDSGDVLVVNGYKGTYKGGSSFDGEVLVIDGSTGFTADPRIPSYDVNRQNLGFNALSILYELPPVQGIRGLAHPVFAERQ